MDSFFGLFPCSTVCTYSHCVPAGLFETGIRSPRDAFSHPAMTSYLFHEPRTRERERTACAEKGRGKEKKARTEKNKRKRKEKGRRSRYPQHLRNNIRSTNVMKNMMGTKAFRKSVLLTKVNHVATNANPSTPSTAIQINNFPNEKPCTACRPQPPAPTLTGNSYFSPRAPWLWSLLVFRGLWLLSWDCACRR